MIFDPLTGLLIKDRVEPSDWNPVPNIGALAPRPNNFQPKSVPFFEENLKGKPSAFYSWSLAALNNWYVNNTGWPAIPNPNSGYCSLYQICPPEQNNFGLKVLTASALLQSSVSNTINPKFKPFINLGFVIGKGGAFNQLSSYNGLAIGVDFLVNTVSKISFLSSTDFCVTNSVDGFLLTTGSTKIIEPIEVSAGFGLYLFDFSRLVAPPLPDTSTAQDWACSCTYEIYKG